MMWLISIPFVLQTVAILVDEFYFHRIRGLPKWERIGHPIDTLSVIACFAFVLFVPYNLKMVSAYVLLSFFSCLLVTKDEFVHKEECTGLEQWLHALLFINHPIVLAILGFMWPALHNRPSLFIELSAHERFLHNAIFMQGIGIFIFFLYQVIYWNFYVKDAKHDKQRFLQ